MTEKTAMFATGEHETLTNSKEELSRKDGANAEFTRSIRMYKLQTSMGILEKHASDVCNNKQNYGNLSYRTDL